MTRQKTVLLLVVLALIAATAVCLLQLRGGQRLSLPGVKTHKSATGKEVVLLPESLPGYTSEFVETPQSVVDALPSDTCFGQRLYRTTDGFQAQLNVVLMGADRSSIHKPEICLPAQGWKIYQTETATIPVAKPKRHDLAIIKLSASSPLQVNGQTLEARGIYVYWFVTNGELSADPSGLRRTWHSLIHLLTTGELQRWAYVSVFATCEPGREETTYELMKQFIAKSVPEFQLTDDWSVQQTK